MGESTRVVGIYHKDCDDGTAAAAVLLKKFPSIELFPLSYSYTDADIRPIKERAQGSEVYFVDCAIGIQDLIGTDARITVVDHHIGMKETLDALAKEKKITYVFDNEKSGATLSWSYFFPNEPLPELLRYIEDSDLWRGTYGEETKQVTNYLSMYANDPKSVSAFFNASLDGIKREGTVITQYADFIIKKFTDNTNPVRLKIGEHEVFAYNTTNYESPIGSILSQRTGRAAVMFTINGDQVRFSFRSKEGQTPSALELAQILKGGGHKNASGARVSLSSFLEMVQR